MKELKVANFGPIAKADVAFGDLTFLVGAQASGKSLFLELLKLVEDKDAIVGTLRKYNYIISKSDTSNLLNAFFGNGMSGVWRDDTHVSYDGKDVAAVADLIKSETDGNEEEKLFYIPAQRIFSISDGRPKAFSEFDPTAPYVLRQFSDILRIFMAVGLGENTTLYPLKSHLQRIPEKSFDHSIFHGGSVELESDNGQRKMRMKVDGMDMPFMTWSAGQKEFMPLLMGFYCVAGSPVRLLNKGQYDYVVIEEPEMGLHPQAILAVLLEILELVQMGKKVIVSTHSTVPLEFVWVFNMLKKSGKHHRETNLMKLFDESAESAGMLEGIFSKTIKTYAFERTAEKVTTIDISSLDAWDDQHVVSEWGGLSSFANRASDLVSEYCNE